MPTSPSTIKEARATSFSQSSTDSHIWGNLKRAIASSSGFQRWQIEENIDHKHPENSLDLQVRRYLRQTLETLAY